MKQQHAQAEERWEAAGKLLLFGEYTVLNGTLSLSFPLKFGQQLVVGTPQDRLLWESHSPDGQWLRCAADRHLRKWQSNQKEAAQTLRQLLEYIHQIRPSRCLTRSFKVTADFDLSWGWGSSSTLVSLLSQWAEVDPYDLLAHSFGGSGYDIACATADHPLLYTLEGRVLEERPLASAVTEKLLFVYSGKKQSSKAEIHRYRERSITPSQGAEMNAIVRCAFEASAIEPFEECMAASEQLIAPLVGRLPLKQEHFADYPHSVKSLGAWGGDFFMATYRVLEEATHYFTKRGYRPMFTYRELAK